ncbi:MAG: Tat pathway signal protein [Leptothrix sp. (in: Bacteria)]|nr:Tat pathway signal protein [Leptothrix sp. (in: b-proteobacteria)]
MTSDSISRRAFLQRGAALSLAGSAAPFALNLATMAEAAAQTSGGADYKALVCVFLQGGNDHGNTLIPFDEASYAGYATARGGVALGRDGLAATALSTTLGGRQLAMAPSLAPLKPLYESGRLAWLLNIGPLVQPTTLAQYQARSVPLPAKLFSHNDQQSAWQSYGPEGTLAGWGGLSTDAVMSGNGRASLTCINTAGNAVYLSGRSAVPYMVNPAGVPSLYALNGGLFGSAACEAAFRQLVTQTSQAHVMASEHARVMARAIDVNAQLQTALAATPALATAFDGANPLANQLRMVAQLIAARGRLGMRRQVFFVSLSGFDLHDNLLSRHALLLGQLASALVSFQGALDELNVAPNVTTFTASDFGRTLSSNGDGSDHGWGGHHLVMGGAVRGASLYGQLPGAGLGGENDTGQGRLLPTMGVQQLAGSLGRWMGVSSTDLNVINPGLGAFNAGTLSSLLTT